MNVFTPREPEHFEDDKYRCVGCADFVEQDGLWGCRKFNAPSAYTPGNAYPFILQEGCKTESAS